MQDSPESREEHLLNLWRARGSSDYAAIKSKLLELQHFVQEEIARRFTPAFNEELKRRPQSTMSEKQTLTRFANAEMREMHLCARSENNQPSVLRAAQGRRPSIGRFQLELLGKENRQARIKDSAMLFPLELMPAPRHEPAILKYWASRAATASEDRERNP